MSRPPVRFWLPAVLLAVSLSTVSFVYGTRVAGGSDSWGYLSQADYWAEGKLPFMDLSFARGSPLPIPTQLFAPLAWEADRHWSLLRAVPITAAGYPLLAAAAKVIGGDERKFWVVPFFAGLLVIATFGIGVRMISPAGGLVAAWLTATSPAVIYMSMLPMSDVPVAGAWAAAIFLLLGESRASAVSAGLMTGLAVMIRPNHLPVVAALGLVYVPGLFAATTRRLTLERGALFAAGALAGIVATAVINDTLHRSPWRSGYGDLGRLFSVAYFAPNLRNYLSWLVESQTPLACAGLLALLLPFRILWPAPGRRIIVVAGAIFVAGLWSIYCFYEVFDAWWYLRFVLGSWPFIMVGAAAVVTLVMRRTGPVGSAVVVVLLVALGAHEVLYARERQAFALWHGDRRYIRAGQMVAKLTEPNSVVLSGQHSGSIRYYAGRVTMRMDRTSGAEVDAVAAWLSSHGAHLYLAFEDWERADLERRWRGSQAAAAMQAPPVGIYRQGNELLLYALTDPPPAGSEAEVITGVDEGLSVPGAAPVPMLFLTP